MNDIDSNEPSPLVLPTARRGVLREFMDDERKHGSPRDRYERYCEMYIQPTGDPSDLYTTHARDIQRILALPPSAPPAKRPSRPKEAAAYIAELYDKELMTGEQEVHQFRKMNFFRARLREWQEKLVGKRKMNEGIVDTMSILERHCDDVRNDILESNLRLVVSIMKKHNSMNFCDNVSDGNMSLLRAIYHFDYSRGNKFSTYASWAINRNFNKTLLVDYRERSRFITDSDIDDFLMDRIPSLQENNAIHDIEKHMQQTMQAVQTLLSHLDTRDADVLRDRFGIPERERDEEGNIILSPATREQKTQKEVAMKIGVTKAGVRFIENRAKKKIVKLIDDPSILGLLQDFVS